MTNLTDLSTPCLLLDLDRLKANCDRMRRHANDMGVRLRPHMKTLKSHAVADIAVDEYRAITVSTLTEAAYFADHGYNDILCAVCLPPAKLERALAIHAGIIGPGLAVLVESLEVANEMQRLMSGGNSRLPVWIEIDCGEHRTGMDPRRNELIELARLVATAPEFELRGVLTHAGQSYGCETVQEIQAIAAEERDAVVFAAERIRAEGIACPGVSAGSTPTAVHGVSWEGVTELRPGVYMAGDLFQVHMKSLRRDDLALSVLATVISSHEGRLVLDVGGLALSKDQSLRGTEVDPRYGELLDLNGRPLGLKVHDVHQEHGEVRLVEGGPTLKVGERVRVIPVHACMTAAAYPGYHLLVGQEVDGFCSRTNGWS